jgi:hypothetical protein
MKKNEKAYIRILLSFLKDSNAITENQYKFMRENIPS